MMAGPPSASVLFMLFMLSVTAMRSSADDGGPYRPRINEFCGQTDTLGTCLAALA